MLRWLLGVDKKEQEPARLIETPRLYLRGFQHGDLDDFYSYARHPEVGPPAGWSPHKNRRQSRSILADFVDNPDIWAIEEKESHKLIGSVGLHPDSRRANALVRSLGYTLGRDFWGKGYATEAARYLMRQVFATRHLELISVTHFASNQRSRQVVLKCGFHMEGILRRAEWSLWNTMEDMVCYSVTQEEFIAACRDWDIME